MNKIVGSVVMMGATGAVGGHVVRALRDVHEVRSITLLGRREVAGLQDERVKQWIVDVLDPASYESFVSGHQIGICTLGVGEPSKVSRDEFVRVDKTAVLDFASSCRRAEVKHFQLLGSVGANPGSKSFYLRTKGELEEGLKALEFERLSIFRPSMILTPVNRYGLSQALMLAMWPRLTPLLAGPLRKYRGVPIETLGRAIALNVRGSATGVEQFHWDEINALAEEPAR